MNQYQNPQDLSLARQMAALAPGEAPQWLAFDHAAFRDGGQIGRREREWIALAVALTTQCAYCIDVHVKAAQRQGTTPAQIAEIAMVAAAVRAGGTLGHGLLALRLAAGESDAGADNRPP